MMNRCESRSKFFRFNASAILPVWLVLPAVLLCACGGEESPDKKTGDTKTTLKTALSVIRNESPQVTGYGKDLKSVLKQALADAEAGKFAVYLRSMLPVSELQRNSVDDLAKRVTAAKSTAKQIVDDLTAMQSATPVMTSGRTVATLTVKSRVFKFQLVDGNWRLYDNTTGMQSALSKS